MKKPVPQISLSSQEEKRRFAIKLIGKKIQKTEVMRLAKISARSYYRYKKLIQTKGNSKAALRQSQSRSARRLTKARKISIMNSLRANPFQSTRDLVDKLHQRISYPTIYRYLIAKGFRQKFPSSHFKLKDGDQAQRLHFARSLRNFFGMAEIVFEDETSFWLFENHLPGWFHKDAKNPLSVEKHSGKIHLCGGISCFGKVFVTTFRKNLNSRRYSKIMERDLIPNANRLYPYGWWLAQDNSPNHQGDALVVKYNDVPYYIVLPPRSPDLNPIENLWSEIKRNVRKRLPQSLDQLEQYALEEWNKISNEKIQNYCESFEERLKEVIKQKGEAIDY